ncbi:hypothetical protein F7725_022877 [Dissostichus mawsoni]|uniref:Uncharacterized protein n=1 Tax=Dissostichus mawsoni TaxID=36200 RepID=A0A7J5YZ19_DISMA|nr:hypothetical protein F7725_022877 [Dissostichus mawsoni]
MIQMPSPSSWSSAFHKKERRTDRVGGKPFCSCVGSPLFPPTNLILIYNERACPTEWGLIGWLGGGTSRDDQRHLRMADGIYLLTVALRDLAKLNQRGIDKDYSPTGHRMLQEDLLPYLRQPLIYLECRAPTANDRLKLDYFFPFVSRPAALAQLRICAEARLGRVFSIVAACQSK